MAPASSTAISLPREGSSSASVYSAASCSIDRSQSSRICASLRGPALAAQAVRVGLDEHRRDRAEDRGAALAEILAVSVPLDEERGAGEEAETE